MVILILISQKVHVFKVIVLLSVFLWQKKFNIDKIILQKGTFLRRFGSRSLIGSGLIRSSGSASRYGKAKWALIKEILKNLIKFLKSWMFSLNV